MASSSNVDLPVRECVRKVCGDTAAVPTSKDESDVKSFFLAVFIALVDSCVVSVKDRQERLEASVRDGETAEMDALSIKKAAACGFTPCEDPGYVSCPACKTREKVDEVAGSDLMKQHSEDCPYPQLCNSVASLEAHQPLSEHLRREWSSTKVIVAKELGYHPCLVLVTLVRSHLRHGRIFPNAGELVEALMDLEESTQSPPVLWDVTPLVGMIPRRTRSSSDLEQSSRGPPVLRDAKTSVRMTSLPTVPSSDRQPGAAPPHIQRVIETPVPDKATTQQQQQLSRTSETRSITKEEPSLRTTCTHEEKSSRETVLEETIRLICKWRCKNCGKIDADHLLVSCGHLALCSNCRLKAMSCPVCDAPITDSIRVYAS